jgi:hypothetical protein
LSAVIGSIKQFTNIRELGLSIGNSPFLALEDQPFFGIDARKNLWTLSIWVRRDTAPGTLQPIVWTEGNSGAGFVFNGPHLQTRFNFDPDEPEAQWLNVVPADQEWHHYLIRTVSEIGNGQGGSNRGIGRHWLLWIDGVFQGQTRDNGYQAAGTMVWADSQTAPYTNALRLGNGSVRNLVGGYDIAGRSLTGALAQLWMGVVSDSEFQSTNFYDGFVDFGTDGRASGRLPAPTIYNLLQQPYLTTGQGVSAVVNTTEFSGTSLGYSGSQALTALTAGATTSIFVVANITAVVSLVANAVVLRSAESSINSNFAITAQGLGIFGTTTAISSNASLTATAFRIKQFACTLSAQATITALVGATEQFNADLTSEFTLEIDVQVKPPIRTEAFLLSTATITIDAASFTDTTTLMASLGTLTADATLIPPIRIEADLVAQTALTAIIGSIEQFAVLTVSSGTMTIVAVKRTGAVGEFTAQSTVVCDATKFTGIILTLSAFNTQLTVGDVINLDPALTYVIPQETREYPILPENRLYEIESETRLLIILKG